jgi:ubiquinone/menaquinone biosynthesis C-methylase UbiE
MEELQRLAWQYASTKALPLSGDYEASRADSKEEIKESTKVEPEKRSEIQHLKN